MRLSPLVLLLLWPSVRAEEKAPAFGGVRFEENRGQTSAAARYLARARGQQIFFTGTGVTLAPYGRTPIELRFAGAGAARWQPEGPPVDSISYYLGNDPSRWVRGAAVYDRIVWRGVYPGVDVAMYGRGDRLEYDLLLQPGADPSRVRLQVDGARPRILADGAIDFAGILRQRPPEIYQQTASGERRRVDGRFVADGRNSLRLELGPYRHSEALVVDPVLELSTYLGAENDDEVVALADGFVVGNTRSVLFPGSFPGMRAGRDIFVRGTGGVIPGSGLRDASTGTVVFGGSGDDVAAGCAYISNFGLYIAGTTDSRDLPSAGTSTYKGGPTDGFVAQIYVSPSDVSLGGVRYVGGSGEDRIHSFKGSPTLTVLAGVTDSPDLPVGDVPQRALAGGRDGFYGILSPLYGNWEIYGYVGGAGDDVAYAAAARDTTGIWIAGETRSTNFPGFTALEGPSDAFLVNLKVGIIGPGVPPVTATTYRLGGNGEDSIRSLVATPSTISASLGSSGVFRTFVVDGVGFSGVTTSTDLPVRAAAQPSPGGGRDAFVGIWDTTAGAPRWLTYAGGSGDEQATSIAQDWAGDLYVGGWTSSRDLPVVQALQPANGGGEDGLFAVYDYTGLLNHLTYFGGSGDDRIRDVRVVYNSSVRIAGSTTSTDLPQVARWQDRGERAEGFVAEIGSDHLLGPSELILAKDGALTFTVRAARASFRNPVTYRSADPSRVRFVYFGRSLDEVTAAPEDTIALEALADSGEVAITVSAPGVVTKTINVKLYPGAYMPNVTAGSHFSTWAAAATIAAYYRALDPATGRPVGTTLALRPGLEPPVVNWSLADPGIFELIPVTGGYQLRALRAGETTLRVSVEGYPVTPSEIGIAAVTPRITQPVEPVFLGRDLSVGIPFYFVLDGFTQYSGFRGTITARSGDPSRLLVTAVCDQVGKETATLTLQAQQQPAICAQALAGEGTVPVYFTSSEFEGEVAIPVTLEGSVLRWGIVQYEAGQNQIKSSAAITAGAEKTNLAFSLESESGKSTGGLRPGVEPPILRLTNSNPRAVELNRLTFPLGGYSSNPPGVAGLEPGTAELTLSAPAGIKLANSTVRIDVTARPAPEPFGIPTVLWVGKGLQAAISFRYAANTPVDAVSSDPASLLLSSTLSVRGGERVSVSPGSSYSDGYLLVFQALKGSGSARARLTFSSGLTRDIEVRFVPAGPVFVPGYTGPAAGFDRRLTVVAAALDPESGASVGAQAPLPGNNMTVRFRSEGDTVRLGATSAVLTADSRTADLDYTLPPSGGRATLIVEPDGDFTVSATSGRYRISGPSVPEPSNTAYVPLYRDEVRQLNLSGQSGPWTITSTDPSRVLVSATATDPGAASVDLPRSAGSYYLHGLADSGSVLLRIEPGAGVPSTITVGLAPLSLSVTGYTVAVGATADFNLTLNASLVRPGAGPYRISIRSSNPAVATVSPSTFEFGTVTRDVFKVTGVSTGTASLLIDGPPEVFGPAQPSFVYVTAPVVDTASYTLGRNLQAGLQIDLGAGFTNPSGAIVTLASSDPSRLVISRASAALGTASVSAAVPAGDRRTQTVYLQALAAGDVEVRATVNGATRTVAKVQIVPSWFSCGGRALTLAAGASQTVSCFVQYTASGAPLGTTYRAGLDDAFVALSTSAPDIVTVTPERLPLSTGSAIQATVKGVALGRAELRVSARSVFDSSPNGSDVVPITVSLPALGSGCAEVVVGKDAQILCSVTASTNATITARSEDPSLLLVSADPRTAGGATATGTGRDVSFALQALAAYGTVEVVFSAAGHQDLRTAVRLRPTQFSLGNPGTPSTSLSLRVGNQYTLTIGMTTSGAGYATPSPASSTRLTLTSSTEGVVSITPSRVESNGSLSVTLRALAPGSTLIRITDDAGSVISSAPLAVTVTP